MEIDITLLFLNTISAIREFLAESFLVSALKFFLFIYVAVLFVDIVLLFILRGGVASDLKATLYGAERPLTSRSKLIRRWEAILARLDTVNASQYKVAVLEADAFADEILREIGYVGETMALKLEQVKGSQLETKESLIAAHDIRNRVVHEAEYALSKEEAEQCLGLYRKFFDEVELF